MSAIKRLAEVGRSLNKDLYSHSDEEVANYTIAEIKKLCFDLRIPNLREYGIDEVEFENAIFKMAKDAIESGVQEIIHEFHLMMKLKSCIENALIINMKFYYKIRALISEYYNNYFLGNKYLNH